MFPLRIASLRLPLRRRGSRACIPMLRLLLREETNQKRYKVKALEPCRRDHFSTALSHFPRSGRTFCRHLCRRERLLGPGAVRRRTHLRARFQSSLLRRRKCFLLGFSPGVFLPRTYRKKKGKQELKKSVVRGKKQKTKLLSYAHFFLGWQFLQRSFFTSRFPFLNLTFLFRIKNGDRNGAWFLP